MTRRRAAQPTANARRRRKPDVHVAFGTDALPSVGEYPTFGVDMRRIIAGARATSPRDQARRYFLETIERHAPAVLAALHTKTCDIDRHNRRALAAAVRAWAQPIGLDVPWMHDVAYSTFTLWQAWPAGRGQRWMHIRNTGRGVPARGRLPRRPPELLIRADHFEWLVRRRVLRQKFTEITTPPETARKAVRALARIIGL